MNKCNITIIFFVTYPLNPYSYVGLQIKNNYRTFFILLLIINYT